jgi:hypothetical protein
VARIWEAEKAERPGLVDGEIVALRAWSLRGAALGVECERVHYRHFLAQRHGLSLGLAAVGVSALTIVRENDGAVLVLLGQRSADVTQYPLQWELVPSGGVSVDHIGESGEVDFVAQVAAELEEETGIPRDRIIDVSYLGLIEDVDEHVVDVAMELEVELAAARLFDDRRSGEYRELALIPIDRALSYIASHGEAVPSVAALLRLRAGREGGPSPPVDSGRVEREL